MSEPISELIPQFFTLWEKIRGLPPDDKEPPPELVEWDKLCNQLDLWLLLYPQAAAVYEAIRRLSDRIYQAASRRRSPPVCRQLLSRLEVLLANSEQPSRYGQSILKGQFALLVSELAPQAKEEPYGPAITTALKAMLQQEPRPENIDYLRRFIRALKTWTDGLEGSLKYLLIRQNFNHPLVTHAVLAAYQAAELSKDGLHGQLEWLMDERAQVAYWSFSANQALCACSPSLGGLLQAYLNGRLHWVEDRLRQRREEAKDSLLERDGDRLELLLPVAMIALLIRLFLAVGLLPDTDINATFGFFARRFYTAKTPFISAHSLQNKSNTIDFKTALKCKELLIKMLNWLNTNFNLSNYRG